jgi:DNA-binding NarL/FixJ family response regulator
MSSLVAVLVSPSPRFHKQQERRLRGIARTARVIIAPSADQVPETRASPQLVVIDFDAAGSHASAAVQALAERFPRAALVVLSDSVDAHRIDSALRAGARAYVPTGYDDRQARLVMELALSGAGHRPHLPQAPIAQEATSAPEPAPAESRGEPLTPKQVEVLSHAASGLSNRQIATRLGIAEGTVKLHMYSIYRKLNVERRGEAIVLARRMDEVRRQQVEQGQRGGALVLDWLLPHVAHRRLEKGAILFRKGDPGDELFYLQRGHVSLDDLGVELGPGQIFGEIGVFAPGRTRTSTARCLTDAELFCLNSEQVKSIYYLNPQFALHIVTLLAQRLAEERLQ